MSGLFISETDEIVNITEYLKVPGVSGLVENFNISVNQKLYF